MTEADVHQPVPEPLRSVAAGIIEHDEFSYTFEDDEIGVPSRFDGPAEIATWRFNGTLSVQVSE